MKKLVLILITVACFYTCKEESSLKFETNVVALSEVSQVEIEYPVAEGNSEAAITINNTISSYIVNSLNFEEGSVADVDVSAAVSKFDQEYTLFKRDFPESAAAWEASIEGEVLYTSPLITTISISSYLYTGGAHGNDYIKLFNFNNANGELLTPEEVLNINSDFMKLAQSYFESEVMKKDENIKDYFFGENFKLPENMGLNERGMIMLYNKYEVASYAQGYTEFLIPFKELEPYLKYQ
ncbi:DUF3298 and DUF4163 domain-containing protein [Paucihalobacter sp.]|uniref:DUF3298 and DUF4163 domain-containing protein n=1 Tax=Paucihalobacter sp. TaxID=2850405 RepID=UPI002FDFFD72